MKGNSTFFMARKQILLFPEYNEFSEKKAGLYRDRDNRAIRSYKCIQDRDPISTVDIDMWYYV